MSQLQDQTLALASMFQSATLINKLANGESINQAAYDCSLDSLFTLQAQSTEDIFGYSDGLITGLNTLKSYLGGDNGTPDRQIAYYVLSMIKLEANFRFIGFSDQALTTAWRVFDLRRTRSGS